ncbi:MAG: transcriptional repressor [Thermoleophilia bacterium]|nr:transcriptional repressor [Thermoleophilia bacterium]
MTVDVKVLGERQQEFSRALAADGLRLTHQRLEIIREIAASDDHPDAETVYRRVRERVPTISEDTVYRTLDVLVKRGLVTRVLMPRATRFDPEGAAHPHFVCERCGRLLDVGIEALPALQVPGVLPGLGDVHSVHLELWGVCEACKD